MREGVKLDTQPQNMNHAEIQTELFEKLRDGEDGGPVLGMQASSSWALQALLE